jgi:hypothetical protein
VNIPRVLEPIHKRSEDASRHSWYREFESIPLRHWVSLVEVFAATFFVRRAHARFALLTGTGETYWSGEIADSAELSLSGKMAVDFSDSPDALVSTIWRIERWLTMRTALEQWPD